MKTLLQFILRVSVGAGTILVSGGVLTFLMYMLLPFLVDRGEHGIVMMYAMYFFGLYIGGFIVGLIVCSSVGGFVIAKIRGDNKMKSKILIVALWILFGMANIKMMASFWPDREMDALSATVFTASGPIGTTLIGVGYVIHKLKTTCVLNCGEVK